MTKIAFIAATGSAQADTIFVGAFGAINDEGNFEIAQELKGIHLFNLLTTDGLKAQGIDLGKSICMVDIEDSAAPALRASVLEALRGRWLSIYDAQSLPPGLAKAALEGERTSVDRAVTKALADIGLPTLSVQVVRAFEDAHVRTHYETDGYYINPEGIALNQAPTAAPWLINANRVPTEALSEHADSAVSANFAAGQLISEITVAGSWADLPAVFAAVKMMPAQVLEDFGFAKNAKFQSVEWYDTPRQRPSQEVPTQDTPAGDEPTSNDPGPSA